MEEIFPTQSFSKSQGHKKSIFAAAGVIITGMLLGLVISYLGNIQYGSNDGSLIVNTAWPLHLGQTAYKDVITGMPPLLLLSAKWSFDIFGVKWSSIVNMTALMGTFFFILQTHIFIKNKIGPTLSTFISLYVQIVCWMPTSFLWHNGMTSASVILLLSSAWFLYKHPTEPLNYVFYSVSVFITLQTKPNLAAPAILLTFLYLFFIAKNLRRKITVCILISFVITYTFLTTFNINPVMVLSTYQLFSNRVLQPYNLINFTFLNAAWEKQLSFLLLLPSLMAFLLFSRHRETQAVSSKIPASEYLFLAIGVLVAVIGITTNNDFKIHEISPIVTSIFLIMATKDKNLPATDYKPASILFNISILLFIVFGIGISFSRIRIYEEGPDVFFQNVPLHQQKSPAFFDGVWAGQRFSDVLGELAAFTTKHGYYNSPHAPVFFGPRLDFAYAISGIEPRPGIPLWWEAFRAGVTQTEEMVNHFRDQHYEYLVLLHCNKTKYICAGNNYNEFGTDMTFFPDILKKYINSAYTPEYRGELTIYHVRNE